MKDGVSKLHRPYLAESYENEIFVEILSEPDVDDETGWSQAIVSDENKRWRLLVRGGNTAGTVLCQDGYCVEEDDVWLPNWEKVSSHGDFEGALMAAKSMIAMSFLWNA